MTPNAVICSELTNQMLKGRLWRAGYNFRLRGHV